jgi:hypothetical protein
MLPYVSRFSAQDRERVFLFLASFSRWECALKHSGFARGGIHGQAEPDWTAFAIAHEAQVAALNDPLFVAARKALLAAPPRRQELVGDQLQWQPNPRRPAETDAAYLFRIVKDVRNSLFHGGKFAEGPVPDLERHRELIDHATAVLEGAAGLHPAIKAILD